jgi:hypothetical protein
MTIYEFDEGLTRDQSIRENFLLLASAQICSDFMERNETEMGSFEMYCAAGQEKVVSGKEVTSEGKKSGGRGEGEGATGIEP